VPVAAAPAVPEEAAAVGKAPSLLALHEGLYLGNVSLSLSLSSLLLRTKSSSLRQRREEWNSVDVASSPRVRPPEGFLQ